MARATDEQCQRWSELERDRAGLVRLLLVLLEDDQSRVGDVYEHMTDNPTWVDSHATAPTTLTPSDILAINSFRFDTIAFMRGHASLPIVLSAPVGQLQT